MWLGPALWRSSEPGRLAVTQRGSTRKKAARQNPRRPGSQSFWPLSCRTIPQPCEAANASSRVWNLRLPKRCCGVNPFGCCPLSNLTHRLKQRGGLFPFGVECSQTLLDIEQLAVDCNRSSAFLVCLRLFKVGD